MPQACRRTPRFPHSKKFVVFHRTSLIHSLLVSPLTGPRTSHSTVPVTSRLSDFSYLMLGWAGLSYFFLPCGVCNRSLHLILCQCFPWLAPDCIVYLAPRADTLTHGSAISFFFMKRKFNQLRKSEDLINTFTRWGLGITRARTLSRSYVVPPAPGFYCSTCDIRYDWKLVS